MEIIKLSLGETEDREICFSEVMFCQEKIFFHVFAIASGELILLVNADLSLEEFADSIQDECEFEPCECKFVSWNTEAKTIAQHIMALDLENIMAYCVESDMECYQCWRHDGNEGLYEAAESEYGIAFVIAHDLLALDNFENVRAMAEEYEDAAELLAVLKEASFDIDVD